MRIEPEGAARTFVARLALENGWRRAHAEAVMEEYRRFLFLAGTSPAPVPPSADVDQAWHLHLLYSRHYWDVFCGDILGTPFHHGPTAGGESEAHRYRRQYEDTLARYRAVFGHRAPAAIWPPQDIRFSSQHVWVDRGRYWMVPKALARGPVLAGGAASLAACAAAASGSRAASINGFGIILGLLGLVVVAVLVLSLWRPRSQKDGAPDSGCGIVGSPDSCGSGCGGGCGGCGG